MFNSNFPVLAVKTIKIRRSSSRVLSIKNGFKESVSQDLLHTFFMTNLPGPLTNPVLYLECVSENVRLPSLIIKKVKIISFLSDEVFIIHDEDITNFELSEQCFGSAYIIRRSRCTDELLISYVNSYKSSLTIIYTCLKMYCYKYVVNFNYFYSCGPGVAI